jgi:hypothetical protein
MTVHQKLATFRFMTKKSTLSTSDKILLKVNKIKV